MGGLEEGCKKLYSQQVDCIIKLALTVIYTAPPNTPMQVYVSHDPTQSTNLMAEWLQHM